MQLLKIISLLLFTVSCKAIPHWKGQKLNGSPHFIPSPCFIPRPQSMFYTDRKITIGYTNRLCGLPVVRSMKGVTVVTQ